MHQGPHCGGASLGEDSSTKTTILVTCFFQFVHFELIYIVFSPSHHIHGMVMCSHVSLNTQCITAELGEQEMHYKGSMRAQTAVKMNLLIKGSLYTNFSRWLYFNHHVHNFT